MTIFRDATPADARALDALFRQSFADTFAHLYDPRDLAAFFARFTPEAWRAELADPAVAVRIAEADGATVGFCKVGPVTLPVAAPEDAIELRQLYVLKPWQGHGIAAALMDWTLAEAERRGAASLYLSVYVDNHRARRFYARYGFVYAGRYDFMVGSHADEDHVMRLDLADR